ncbi:hypothetical protein Tco_1312341 [Tanacetum coccineum]
MKKFTRRQKEIPIGIGDIDGEGVDRTNHSENEDNALIGLQQLQTQTQRGVMNTKSEIAKPDLCMIEPSELVSEPVVNESNVECQPKVWSDAPIIEEYESDSEDECVSIPTKQQETPSFANKQVKTPRETVKNQFTHIQKPKVDKKDLGHGFTVRACFVCGSLNHLIRDCDFHEKRMARKAELNNGWNNVQRVNKQNQFVPSAVLTRTGIIPVNTARTSELQHFNLFSVSQICDKKNKVLFTDSECLVLSSEFKLPDENQVLLKIPRQNNMYSFNLENIVPSGGLACLIAKATTDESNKWHRSDYVGANLDRKSTTGGCQFLGRRPHFLAMQKADLVLPSTTRINQSPETNIVYSFGWTNVSTMEPEQRHITAKVAGKSVSISEASIRSDLLFDDADGIDSLPNQAIFDAIQLMGHLDAKIKIVNEPPRFISIFLDKQLANVSVPLDHFPVNTLTSKVFSFMVKKGKHFSGKVTPLFATMLVQPTQDEGASSHRPFEAQPTPSSCLPLVKTSPTPIIPDSIPETSGENLGGHSSSDKSLSGNEGDMTLQSHGPKKCLIEQRFPRQELLKRNHRVHKGPVYPNRWEEGAKGMRGGQENEGRRDKRLMRIDLALKIVHSTDKELVSTTRRSLVRQEKVSTGQTNSLYSTAKRRLQRESFESTDRQRKGTEDQTKEEIAAQATQTHTSTVFGDDETIAKVLLNMSQAKAISREKEKGVELKDIEEADRPRPTSTRSLLTLKPLPKIDPKDKGKKKIEEEMTPESESDVFPQAEKKFKQLESDEELARKIQEEWEGEEERKRIAEEKAANEALIRNFDDIKARIEADRLLAEKLQEQEREQFTIEERAKFLHDTIAAQRKFLAQQRSEAIRNKPPTKNQLRNQMMTYLKHVGNYKHAELKIKKFEEVQALYRKIKSEVIKEESKEEVQEESKEEESTRKRKLGTRKKMKSRKRRYIQNTSEDDSDKENDELRLHLTIAPDEEKEVDYEILDRKYPIKEWKKELTETGLVIHMLVEKRYPLRKQVLMQMLKLKLESEEDSTMALELISLSRRYLQS